MADPGRIFGHPLTIQALVADAVRARDSLPMAFAAVAGGVFIGRLLGGLAGFVVGWINRAWQESKFDMI